MMEKAVFLIVQSQIVINVYEVSVKTILIIVVDVLVGLLIHLTWPDVCLAKFKTVRLVKVMMPEKYV